MYSRGLGNAVMMGFFHRRKLSRFAVFVKVFLLKSIFKQLDTTLVGVVHWVTTNLLVFSAKIYFQAIVKVFSTKETPYIW